MNRAAWKQYRNFAQSVYYHVVLNGNTNAGGRVFGGTTFKYCYNVVGRF